MVVTNPAPIAAVPFSDKSDNQRKLSKERVPPQPAPILSWQLESNFLVAIRYADLTACATVLAAGADCDQMFKIDMGERTALSIAAGHPSPEAYKVVDLLLQHGASINLPDSNGATSLHTAVKAGSERICRLLLENRANVDAVDKGRVSPLLLAARRGSYNLVKLLLDSGADVNRFDNSCATPLHHACERPQIDARLIHLLVRRGAEVNATAIMGFTPLDALLRSSTFTYETVKLFVENGSRSRLNVITNGKAPIHHVVLSSSRDKLRCLQLLLENSANVNTVTDRKQTALHLSVLMSDVDCARVLLLANIKTNTTDRLGMTPLALAVDQCNREMMKVLVDEGLVRMNSLGSGINCRRLRMLEERKEFIKKICTPPTLMEIARKGIWSLTAPSTAERVGQFVAGGQLPARLAPFVLLQEKKTDWKYV